jgi:predicted dienelactone hydrolase
MPNGTGRRCACCAPILAFAFLVAPLLPARAQAADRCLEGGFLLGDQRALAELREAIEVACPCASAESRSAYRRCAGDAIEAALDAGALRRECKRAAKRVVKGSVCGEEGKVACGLVPEKAEKPVACKVTPAAKCVDTSRADASACAAQTHCADVVAWTAGTCSDPRARGPYEAGATVLRFTRPSTVDPKQDRALDTVVWYPALPGSGPLDGAYEAVLDAPLDPSGGPYPIVMFSHGSCGYPEQSNFLWPLVASRGFVVAAPPHPGNTLAEFPACNSAAAIVASYQERPDDVIFAFDRLLDENAEPASRFFGAIDPPRAGMAGHSFGGLTTYLVLERDSRFAAAVPLAPAVPPTKPLLPVPSLTMIGAIDSLVDNADVRVAFSDALPPKHLVEILNAGHFAFSDFCFPGFPDCRPPVTLTQDEAHAAVVRYVVPFLEWRLRSDENLAAFFREPLPPGTLHTDEGDDLDSR